MATPMMLEMAMSCQMALRANVLPPVNPSPPPPACLTREMTTASQCYSHQNPVHEHEAEVRQAAAACPVPAITERPK